MKKHFILPTLVLSVALGILAHTGSAKAAYDPANLISDSIFNDTSTMNAGDIQNFLNSKGSGISNLTDTESCSAIKQPYAWTYYPHCGTSVSAATIIYDAARAYNINPRVIIATLQKEQSLITTPNPTTSQINCAMGYNSCGGYVGFFSQVDNGTWQLRTYVELMSGRNWWGYTPSSYPCRNGHDVDPNNNLYSTGLYPGRTVTFYNPGGSARTVTLASASTAALYCYTPYVGPFSETGYSGSYNFVVNFENWFGSTIDGQLSIAHPDGTLIRAANTSAVYVLVNGQAQLIPSLGVFTSWNYNFGVVKLATQDDLTIIAATVNDASHTTTPPPMQYKEGSLIKGSGPAIYVMQKTGSTITKRAFDSWATFIGLGYNYSRVVSVPDSELPSQDGLPVTSSDTVHPDGSLIRDPSNPTVYYIIAGQRYAIGTAAVFASQRFNWLDVEPSTAGDNLLPISSTVITWYGEGTLLKGSGPAVYIVDLDTSGTSQSKRVFSYSSFVGLNYSFNNVLQVNDSELPAANGLAVGN